MAYSTLDVEYSVVTPAMFIITDQCSLWVCGQRCLASAGQPKEHRDIAFLTLIGRRMQGQYIMLDRHLVEQDGEDSFLHFTGILCPKNNHLFLGEINGHGCRRRHPGGETIGRERASIIDGIVRFEMLELFP